jgi:hypothetical protein
MREVRIPAFAKINLCLDILGKRADGYHELRTIFQSVSLHDDLHLRASKLAGISLSIQGNAALSQEPFQKNLVYRAVDALRHELKIRTLAAAWEAVQATPPPLCLAICVSLEGSCRYLASSKSPPPWVPMSPFSSLEAAH